MEKETKKETKKDIVEVSEVMKGKSPATTATEIIQEETPEPEPTDVQKLLETVEKQAEQIKMLTEVADRGRMLNYQAKKDPTKKPMKVSLSIHEDKIVIGWRTIKDILKYNPLTGNISGEVQEYEILLLDKEGKISKGTVNGYLRFSDIRYSERIEVEVVGKKEDYDGKIEYEVLLPDERQIIIDARFIN